MDKGGLGMKLKRYQHACFTVEIDNQSIVIDPGGFSHDFITPDNVVAVIVTHEHGDHFNSDHIERIININPDALIIGPRDVVLEIDTAHTKIIETSSVVKTGVFELEFFVGQHALIHGSIPRIENIGLMINRLLYYPGDSFITPNKPVYVLALPIAAPWLKLSESMDFLVKVKPRIAFPTHDAILTDIGKTVSDSIVKTLCADHDITYKRIDAIEI